MSENRWQYIWRVYGWTAIALPLWALVVLVWGWYTVVFQHTWIAVIIMAAAAVPGMLVVFINRR